MPIWLVIAWPIFVCVVFIILPVSLEYYFENKKENKDGHSGTSEKDD